jgi:hypothetical protein
LARPTKRGKTPVLTKVPMLEAAHKNPVFPSLVLNYAGQAAIVLDERMSPDKQRLSLNLFGVHDPSTGRADDDSRFHHALVGTGYLSASAKGTDASLPRWTS